MGAIRLWVPTEWRRRWLALLALALLVALAGGVATALWAGARRADTAYARFQDATGSPNLTGQLRLSADRTTDLVQDDYTRAGDAVAEVAAVPGVERVSTEAWWAAELESEISPEHPEAFLTGMYTSAGPPSRERVVAGRYPAADEPNGVLVNDEAVRRKQLRPGSVVRLRTVAPDRFGEWAGNDGSLESLASYDGPTIDAVVTGVARSEEDFLEDRDPVLVLTEAFARAYGDQVAHVVPTMAIRADPERVDEVAAQLRPILDAYGMDLFPAERTDVAVAPSISVEVTTLEIAAVIAALAGLVVVAQATGRQVVAIGEQQQVRAALGMTRDARIAGSWLAVAPAMVVGALAAPALAWAVSGLFPRGVARQAEPEPGLRLDAVALAVGALATFVVVAAVVWLVALLDARPPRSVRPGRWLLSGALLARPSMWLGVSFATSPAGRGRRLPLVAGTAMLGVALGVGALFVVATIESSRSHLESSPRLYGSPTNYGMPTNGQEGIPEAIDAVLATEGVDALTERMMINDDELEATGPRGARQVAPMAYLALRGGAMPPLVKGRFPQGPDEVALGRGTARDLGAQLGDTVHIPSVDGSSSFDLTVTGLVLPGGTQDQSKAFIVSPTTLGTLLCDGGPLDECSLSVDLFANAPTTPAGAALEDIGFQAASVPPSVERIGQAGALPWYLAGFLCLLGAAGLLHELVTTVRRRRHDLAVTRALGLTANRAATAVTWQAVLTASAGALLGLLLGALVGPLIWSRIAEDLGVLDATALPPVWLAALLLLAVLAVAYALAWPPRWRASRLPMAMILRSE